MPVSYRTVEFHRFGESSGEFRQSNRYIRATGVDAPVQELSPTLDHRLFRRSLNMLRYGGATPGELREALKAMAHEAAVFLTEVDTPPDDLLQVDVVTNAAELWAFPFEACFDAHAEWLADRGRGVVITRRIRGAFAAAAPAWPAVPRVLFVHAPVAADLEPWLVNGHTTALTEALEPWTGGSKDRLKDLLLVREVTSAKDILACRREFEPAQIHVLAHGARVRPDPFLPEEVIWGLRLGGAGEFGTPPEDLEDAFGPSEGIPVVVTLAACDTGNQADSSFAPVSVVQALHRRDVPVVIGSQLPLTKLGSIELTRAFYTPLFEGEDVRCALHAGRVALKKARDAGHDWLSLVGYVRLPPEGYATHLAEVELQIKLRQLEVANAEVGRLVDGPPEAAVAALAPIEQRLLAIRSSLEARRSQLARKPDLLEENHGLEASAYKRLAELQFDRGRLAPASRAADWQSSRESLFKALAAYQAAYYMDLRRHWLGVQQLALEIVLTGQASRPQDYDLVTRVAELERDAAPIKGTLNYWSCGTLAELAFLAPFVGRPRNLDAAKASAALLVERARAAGEEFGVTSTRRQFERYVRWWTKANGYFAGGSDLVDDAREVVDILSAPPRPAAHGAGA